ncbi:MAG: 2-oxoglutarate dehydrogenase, E2 component, dihydrolipoamide succinyltransferase, partial [Actinomycetota bacterium]|nr:2-oxoglutarate dehydrogenase, E2 component, dihydrolipoamide succinyltransferase [Actinomycetota bacterium]
MRLTQKLAIGATSLGGLAIGSLGLGLAHAQTPTPAPAPAVTAPAPNASANQGGVDNSAAEAPDAPETAAA